jgi:hypothetical protein
LSASFVNTNAADSLKTKVIGKWEVNIVGVPIADQGFVLEIREKDNAIVFDVLGGGIGELDYKEMRFTEKNNKLSANLYIGEFITLVIWEEGGVIKGALLTSMIGDVPLAFKKIEKKN